MNEDHFTVAFKVDGMPVAYHVSLTFDLFEREECTERCDHKTQDALIRRLFSAQTGSRAGDAEGRARPSLELDPLPCSTWDSKVSPV
jgi:hypothetical protein